jgi:class 3 adenylate cyclase/tetratricopeptide (TPR) repeat protein
MSEPCCHQCKEPVSATAKFCAECGAKLGSLGDAAPKVGSGERRQVTILFADITGYTRLSSELDPEELHALLERYFDTVDGLIRDFGGTVDKHIGDAVMGVFGAPVSHGNDPERAVRAALEIHRGLIALSAELERSLSVHIGIANGEVVAGSSGSDVHREYTVLGDAVNLASRLDGLASAGETVVSAGVYRAVATLVDASSAGEVAVKGLAEPVRVYKVRSIAEAQPEFRTPLVGRAEELSAFADALRSAAEGRGTVLHVRGEAGVGKTRLLAEMKQRASSQGFECHAGLIFDFGTGRGQDAVRSLARSVLGIPSEASVDQRELRVAGFRDSLSEEQRSCLNDLLELPQPPALRSRYEAMSEQMRASVRSDVICGSFERASQRAPLLLVVEDVHWADEATLDTLAKVAEHGVGARILLVLTSRIDGDPLDRGWQMQAAVSQRLVRLELLPLSAQALAELAEHWGAPDSTRLRACVERCGGNPLFLEQLLASEAEGVLPDSVQSLVQARMDRLPGQEKRALQAASVIGQRFSLDLLRHLIGEPDYSCAVLVERGLVRPLESDWLFAHALVRDGVYSSLLKQVRRELHKRTATWFGTSDLVLRAEHLDRAEEDTAPRAYLAAAAARIDALEYERAVGLLRRGAELAHSPRDRHALARRAGELMLYRADATAALEAFERALGCAETEAERCSSWVGLADSYRIVQQMSEGHRALDEALQLVSANGMDAELSRIYRIRGSLKFTAGVDSRAEQELALEHATLSGDVELEARALSCLGDAYYLSGSMRTALDYFSRAVELSRKHGLGRVELYQYYMLGVSRLFGNDMRGAIVATETGIEQAQRAGHRRAEMIARETRALVLIQMGRFEPALQEIDVAIRQARATSSPMFEGMLLAERADALCQLGRLEEAALTARECRALNIQPHWWLVGPMLASLDAWFASSSRQLRDSIDAASVVLVASPPTMTAFYHARLAHACLVRCFYELAERHAKLALESVEDAAYIAHLARRVLALLAHRVDPRSPVQRNGLTQLRSEAEAAGLEGGVKELDRLLAEA